MLLVLAYSLLLSFPLGKGAGRVVCYYASWSSYRKPPQDVSPANLDPHLCTHLIYASALPDPDDGLRPSDPGYDLRRGYKELLQLKKANPNLKVMLSVEGIHQSSKVLSSLLQDPRNRCSFVRFSIDFLRRHHFDGLDINWQYPGDRNQTQDKESLSSLVEEMREEMERDSLDAGLPRLILSLAVPPTTDLITAGFNLQTLNKYVDFFNIFSMDYHTSEEPFANHPSPLFSMPNDPQNKELNVDSTVKHYVMAGVSTSKIVVGIPVYGRTFVLQSSFQTDLGAPTTPKSVRFKKIRETLAYYEICKYVIKGRWQIKHPNTTAMGPYAHFANIWVGYDDPLIVSKKAEYVRDNGLGGLVFWTIDQDDVSEECGESNPIIKAGRQALLEENSDVAHPTPSIPSAIIPSQPEGNASTSSKPGNLSEGSATTSGWASTGYTYAKPSVQLEFETNNQVPPSWNLPTTTSMFRPDNTTDKPSTVSWQINTSNELLTTVEGNSNKQSTEKWKENGTTTKPSATVEVAHYTTSEPSSIIWEDKNITNKLPDDSSEHASTIGWQEADTANESLTSSETEYTNQPSLGWDATNKPPDESYNSSPPFLKEPTSPTVLKPPQAEVSNVEKTTNMSTIDSSDNINKLSTIGKDFTLKPTEVWKDKEMHTQGPSTVQIPSKSDSFTSHSNLYPGYYTSPHSSDSRTPIPVTPYKPSHITVEPVTSERTHLSSTQASVNEGFPTDTVPAASSDVEVTTASESQSMTWWTAVQNALLTVPSGSFRGQSPIANDTQITINNIIQPLIYHLPTTNATEKHTRGGPFLLHNHTNSFIPLFDNGTSFFQSGRDIILQLIQIYITQNHYYNTTKPE